MTVLQHVVVIRLVTRGWLDIRICTDHVTVDMRICSAEWSICRFISILFHCKSLGCFLTSHISPLAYPCWRSYHNVLDYDFYLQSRCSEIYFITGRSKAVLLLVYFKSIVKQVLQLILITLDTSFLMVSIATRVWQKRSQFSLLMLSARQWRHWYHFLHLWYDAAGVWSWGRG